MEDQGLGVIGWFISFAGMGVWPICFIFGGGIQGLEHRWLGNEESKVSESGIVYREFVPHFGWTITGIVEISLAIVVGIVLPVAIFLLFHIAMSILNPTMASLIVVLTYSLIVLLIRSLS